MSTENKKKDFVWTDELVLEFASNARYFTKNCLNNFKDLYGEKRSPEYEILSRRYTPSGEVISEERYKYSTEAHYANPDRYAIHSVRRLSDGVVFSVGDTVYHVDGLYPVTIIEFYQPPSERGEMWFYWSSFKETVKNLDNFKKQDSLISPPKKPLFTTEDGVEIHAGEIYYHVSDDLSLTNYEATHSGRYPNFYAARCFSTQKAAIDFIESQKPKLLFRTEDGVDIYEGDECYICKKSATPNKWNIHKWFKACKEGIDTEGEKYFNSLKAAEEWMAAQKPPVLFTTEDGVDITDHKTPLYMVLAKATWQTGETTTERHLSRAVAGSSAWKYFAIEYNRDRYILLNKPLLSVSDVMDLYQNHSENFETFLSAVNEAAKAKG